jgi:hypothetical protein
LSPFFFQFNELERDFGGCLDAHQEENREPHERIDEKVRVEEDDVVFLQQGNEEPSNNSRQMTLFDEKDECAHVLLLLLEVYSPQNWLSE